MSETGYLELKDTFDIHLSESQCYYVKWGKYNSLVLYEYCKKKCSTRGSYE